MYDPQHLRSIEHSFQRKASLVSGSCTDHASSVHVRPIPNFDLDKTIFTTLKGVIPRLFMTSKIAKEVTPISSAEEKIEQRYQQTIQEHPIPSINSAIIDFMTTACDFNAEHADGSFLEHLLFGYDYAALYFPQCSPVVMLLHSILGTATNTFAMDKSKIPQLQTLLTEFEFLHISAFPSFLRLFYTPKLFDAIDNGLQEGKQLDGITVHRVIDNERIYMDADNMWIQLNYHLIHYIDFLPASNWHTHLSDPVTQSFLELYKFVEKHNKKMAQVVFSLEKSTTTCENEELSMGSRFAGIVPTSLKKKLAAKSIQRFSDSIGHSLDFTLSWK